MTAEWGRTGRITLPTVNMAEVHAYIRTAAALVVATVSAYRIAEYEQEQACWARVTAHYGRANANRETHGFNAYTEMHNECDALR